MSSDDIKLSLDEVKANLPTIAEDVLGLYNLQFSFNEFADILKEFGGASSELEISNVDYRPYLSAIKEIYMKFLIAQDAYLEADAERFYEVNREEILQLTFKQWSENRDRYGFDYDRDLVNIFNSVLKVFDKYTYGIGVSDPEMLYNKYEDIIFKDVLDIIGDPYKDELLEAKSGNKDGASYDTYSENDPDSEAVSGETDDEDFAFNAEESDYEDENNIEEHYEEDSEEAQEEKSEDGLPDFFECDFDAYIDSYEINSRA